MALTDTSLTAEEAATVLTCWGLEVQPEQLSPGSGTANASVIVHTDEGRLLLRRRNPRYAHTDWVRFDHALFAHLRSCGLPAPETVVGPNGEGWVIRTGRIYELFRYIEGDQHRPGAEDELADAGRTLARVHAATADFLPPASKLWPRFHSPVLARDGLRELLEQAEHTNEPTATLKSLESAIRLAEELVERLPDERYRALPQAIVHGDYHPGNLKFQGGRVVGLFDWDWASRQPRMVDVADGLLFFCAVRDTPMIAGDIWSLTSAFSIAASRADVFASAYAAHIAPERGELAALPDLMRCRWLFCRVDAAQRKVEPERRVEFVTRDLERPLQEIAALEQRIIDGTLFSLT